MNPIPLPERGTAFDVGEEEGDSAGGEIGLDPFQTLRWTWYCSILARDCKERVSEIALPGTHWTWQRGGEPCPGRAGRVPLLLACPLMQGT
jgi:hypothetical protein